MKHSSSVQPRTSSVMATKGDPQGVLDHPHPLRGLLVAQFWGAFNDNAWKMMVAFLVMRAATAETRGVDAPSPESQQQGIVAICFVVFTLPLMLVSLPAGVLADRWSKRTVIVTTKALEVILMAAGAIVLYLSPGHTAFLLVILGCMGMQSALFSPAKYGILPELLSHERLSWGNGLLEMWTFIAIVTGTAAGGLLLDGSGQRVWLAGCALCVASIVGLIAAMGVPRVRPARDRGGLADTVRAAWSVITGDRVLYLAVAGSVLYWAVAGLLGQNVVVYTKSITHGMAHSDTLSALPLGLLGVGVGVGSVLAGRWSAGKVEYGLIPLGTAGMAILTLLFGLTGPGITGTVVLMGLVGVCSGLVMVPLNAIFQWRSPADRRGAVIAAANVVIFAGVLTGSLAGYGLLTKGLNAQAIVIVASLVVAGCGVWAVSLVPDALVRLGLVLVTHSLYRLRVVGRHHVPATGPALLVPNHVTFVDGLMILASTDRPVRFVVDASYDDKRWLRPLMRCLGAIPISSTGGPRVILQALRDAGGYLDRGELVCIFPEGQITRTGATMPLRRGMERIVKGRTAPIIPVYLDKLWGSIFSYKGGQFLSKLPRRIPYPVTVSIGRPLPSGTALFEARQAVLDLGRRAWEARRTQCDCLHRTWIRRTRRRPFRLAMGDATRPRLSGIEAVAGAISLGRVLGSHLADHRRIGVLLPPSVAGSLVNIAAAVAGRTSVNLNYTAGPAAMRSAVEQAGLRSVVTSRAFLGKASITPPTGVELLYLEDLSQAIGVGTKVVAFLLAVAAPCRVLERYCGATEHPDPRDELTIIFSSGSTGDPKGVILTHANIDSNVEAVAQVFRVRPDDRMLGILPQFHSFGYMTLWLAVNHGIGVVFHPNPLDVEAVGRLVSQYRLTVLIATPTFLQLYLKRCDPGALGSLRLVLTGAEKLPARLSDAFEQRFGIRPIEGYGTTECSPVIAVGSPDVRYGGVYQAGSRRGTVGQPLPGVSVRVVDPDTHGPVGPGHPGVLWVRGPNVMRGYLGRDDLTAKVMHDGWYVTGDMATIDEDGFITITDRLSRFSKIGGEMVPHGRVEDALHEAAGVATQTFAVTAVPDDRKGERLVVLHTHDVDRIPQLLSRLAEMGLPNLFIPRPDQFVKVDCLPFLGTGKLDLRRIKAIAIESVG